MKQPGSAIERNDKLKFIGHQALPYKSVAIVPFSPAHYPHFTRLWNETYPDLERTEMDFRLADLSPENVGTRWVAEQDSKPLAVAALQSLPNEQFDLNKFQLHLMVNSNARRQGIGSMMLQHVINDLRTREATLVRVWVRDDRNESLRFVEAHGFVEEMRTYHSSLVVSSFDLTRLTRYRERLQRNNYTFGSFDELRNDPQRNQKAHSIYCEVMREIPSAEPPTLPTFEEYEERIRTTPEFFRAHFFATYKGEFVGICILLPKDRRKHQLYADTLGVKRNFRGRGIAQALSHCGIEYAKSRGYALISADNFSENIRIIPLLDSLGFGHRSAWTLFSKSLEQ